MEKGQIWAIVLGVIVLAAIISIVTANITGNAIFKSSGLYTKAEIDMRISQLNRTMIGFNTTITNRLNNLTLSVNSTLAIINNTWNVISGIVNTTGNWSIPGNVTIRAYPHRK